METLARDDLAQLISQGAVADIARAERAYSLLKVIGENADSINRSKQNFGELFGVIQGLAEVESLLAIARLYDRPSKTYPTRCIRALLNTLECHAEHLPPITEKATLVAGLAALGLEASRVGVLTTASDPDATREMVSFLRSRLKQRETMRSVKRLKNVRDKLIAHNEAVHELDGPTWEVVLKLLSLAKEIVGIVGWAYLRIAYVYDDGTYALSSDSERPALAMQRLLEELGIVGPDLV